MKINAYVGEDHTMHLFQLEIIKLIHFQENKLLKDRKQTADLIVEKFTDDNKELIKDKDCTEKDNERLRAENDRLETRIEELERFIDRSIDLMN